MVDQKTDDCDAYPLSDIREAAVRICEEILWINRGADVVAVVSAFLARVDSDYEKARGIAMAKLDPDQDFDLCVVASRYLVGNFEEIEALAAEHPAPVTAETALRAGYAKRAKEAVLDEGTAEDAGGVVN